MVFCEYSHKSYKIFTTRKSFTQPVTKEYINEKIYADIYIRSRQTKRIYFRNNSFEE